MCSVSRGDLARSPAFRRSPAWWALLACLSLPLPGWARTPHTIRVDGDLSEFSLDELVAKDTHDSVLGSTNDISGLYVTWDRENLYLGLWGQVSGKGWLLYIDTGVGLPAGTTDLTDPRDMKDNRQAVWKKNARFFAPGVKVDLFYGAWNGSDGDLYQIVLTTLTLVRDFNAGTERKTNLGAARPGSEIQVSWNGLYGLGTGKIPVGARIGMVAAIAGDVNLEGDVIPDNRVASLPDTDNAVVVDLDRDRDGRPDMDVAVGTFTTAGLAAREIRLAPNPFSPNRTGVLDTTELSFRVESGFPVTVTVSVYDLNGRLVRRLADGAAAAAGWLRYVWDGKDADGAAVPGGLYPVHLRVVSGDETVNEKLAAVVIR